MIRRKTTTLRFLVLLSMLAVSGSVFSAGCSEQKCPCAPPPGFEFDLRYTSGVVTVTALQGGATVDTNMSLHELEYLDEGVYDLIFYMDGAEIGRLDGVCTPGPGTAGCNCAPAGPLPLIRINQDSVELVRQGC